MTHVHTSPANASREPHDGILLLSFGGPEGHDDVLPFLERVTAGRGIPAERLAEVAEHYHARGGISPINGQNRLLVEALEAELSRRALDVPVRLGNRNSAPFLTDTLRELYAVGCRRVLVILTSAYSSYSSCRQYRENLADAVRELGLEVGRDLEIDKVEPWYGVPGFVETFAEGTVAALGEGVDPAHDRILYVTHSIPEAMAQASGPPHLPGLYVDQHRRVAAVIDAAVQSALGEAVASEVVFCSRSGPPRQPWLEPDVGDRLRSLAEEGVRRVALVPIGFVSDHMEVLNDLDDEAVTIGRQVGIEVARVATPGTAPALVANLVDLIVNRTTVGWVVPGDRRPPRCEPNCCPNLRGSRPALCGSDGSPS